MMDQGRRRAARARGKVDYAKLHGAEVQSDDEHQVDLGHLAQRLLSHEAYTSETCCRATPGEFTSDFIHSRFTEPVIIPPSSAAVQQLGMVLPPAAGLTVPEVAKVVGYDKEVATFNVGSQGEGPKWNLLQWLQYWCTRQGSQERKICERRNSVTSLDDEADSRDAKRREWEAKARNIKVGAWVQRGISAESRRRLFQASFPVSGTSLEDAVLSPRAVRESDLVQRFWPPHATEEVQQQRPHIALQLSVAPSGSFRNFRLGPGGASTWVHVISGKKVFALLPPSRDNLAAYVSWFGAARQAGVFLPEHAQGCVKVEVPAGATFFIPGGWMFAEAMPSDCVAVGGQFLHAGAMTTQLQVGLIEEHLALRRQHRFPQNYQVLWYTAAHYARRLVELCPLGPEEVRERAAQKSGVRRAADEAAVAEQATKAAASRAMSADRKARQHIAALARPAEKEQQPVPSGRRKPTADAGGSRRAARQAQKDVAPQKRQRRVTQKVQEAMDDPDLDFGTAPESGDEDAPPVRTRRRQSGRLQDDSGLGSDDTSEEAMEEEESSDEELRAMANIRRRRQRQIAPAAGPKVRLRTGAGPATAAQQATPPKLRLKYSASGAAAAQPTPAERAGRGRARWQLEDDSDDDVAAVEAVAQLARQPARATSLKLKLKFGEGGNSIPQVDGADDSDGDEALHAEPPRAETTDLQAAADESAHQTVHADASAAAVGTQDTAPLDAHCSDVKNEAPEAGGVDEPAEDAAAAPSLQQGADSAPEGLLKEEAKAAKLQLQASDKAEGHPDVQAVGAELQAGGIGVEPKETAAAGQASQVLDLILTEGPAAVEAPSAPEAAAGSGPLPAAAAPSADAEKLPAEQPQGADNASLPQMTATGQNGHADHGNEAKQRAPRPLSAEEKAGVPALVHALRRWLRELGGHPFSQMEDPERMLDELEVCLAAMGMPVASVAPPVDFDDLPSVKLPGSSLAPAQDLPEDSAGEGTGLQGASEDEPLEEDPQEELGDSTLEAQARGSKRQKGPSLGGRGGVRKKPSVRDRLTKKLRIR